MRPPTRTRRGFSLVEIITALTILAVIGAAMTKMMLSQTRNFQYDSGGRRSRTAARSAMNILITDLRMTQDNGGVTAVDATNNLSVDARVPIGFGVVCSTAGTSLIMALAPVDSFQYEAMKFGGYGVRNATTGIYSYVAGGTGFAPLKSILRHALEGGSTREIHFYWGARQEIDVYEEALVMDWARQYPQLHFTVVLSEASAVDPTQAAHRRLGWVHEAALADHPSLANFEVYVAGPPALVEAIRATYPTRGLSADRLHFDSFDYAPS